ncbi:MAG: hypothetical protein IT384_26095 [Deltaproteobacteria bacterium]|nr:hypothetical protein [Deltaproteobacteria bacterium]
MRELRPRSPVYTDDLVWDSVGLDAYLIGADHLAPEGPQIAHYSAASNAWERLARPDWLAALTFFHGYDHTAIDAVRRNIYHRPFGQNRVQRADIDGMSWAPLPDAELINTYQNCCDALEYFPPLDGLVWIRGVGEVWLFDETQQAWRQLGTWAEDGNTWTFAEYSAARRTLIFGSGNGNNLFKLDATGTVSRLTDPPVPIYDGSGYVGVLTSDPISGTFLLLTPTARELYSYDVDGDAWLAAASSNKPSLNNLGVVATPVPNYGVVLFAACGRGDCRAYLYRH